MALTKIGTDGIKDDAVTSGKIPANAVGSSELADNAVDTDAIQNDAVTNAKIADGAVGGNQLGSNAVTAAKIGANEVTAPAIAAGAVGSAKIADQAVTLDKLPHGTGSNNGKFLRANNGADPSFETVNTDLVSDTSPQLGGHLESNGYDIKIADSDEIKVGTGNDLLIYHSNNQSYVQDNGAGDLTVASNSKIKIMAGDENSIICNENGSVVLHNDNVAKLYTNQSGVNVDKCIQAGSVQTPIERDITHHQSHDPAAIFYPEGAYGNNNSPTNERQAFIIGATKGNWSGGHSSSDRSVGVKFSRITNNAEKIRAGIQHDIAGVEKFKFWASYGDIHFRTRNDNNGNKTWEECDKDPLIMHHNGHVSMMHMPRILLNVGTDSNSYSSDMTLHTITGTATTHGGMTYSNGTITVPYQGVYQICANVGIHTSSSNTQRLDLLINNSNWQRTEHAGASGWQTQHITHVIELAANNTIKFNVAGKWDAAPFSKISVCMMHGTLTT